jgi:hypothetical protein
MRPPKPEVHTLKAFRMLKVQGNPRVAIIAFQTEQGPKRFRTNRQMLLRLAQAFRECADDMPPEVPH